MNIGARLLTVAGMVPAGASLADVGTDHAYLPVWLVQQGLIRRAIASDIAAGPCAAARATVEQFGRRLEIDVRQGNGLACITPGEINTLVIAGMGASTIIEILQAAPAVVQGISHFILQPMVGVPQLRLWALRQGLTIDEEQLCEENGRLYVVLRLKRVPPLNYTGENLPVTLTREELEVGPCLIKKGGALYEKYLTQLLEHHTRLLRQMSGSRSAQQSEKYQELSLLVKGLEVLKDACRRT